MNNLAKLTFLLSAACPMLFGQSAPKAADPQPKAQSAAKEQPSQMPPPKAPNAAKEQSPQPPPKPPAPPLLGQQEKLTTQAIKLNHADPNELLSILEKLSSFPDLSDAYVNKFETSGAKGIIVKDTPSVVATIVRTASLLDVPNTEPDTVTDEEYLSFDFRVDVIWAAANGYDFPTKKATPPYLSDVIGTITKTFNYRIYAHGGTFTQRVSADGKSIKSQGAVVSPLKDIPGSLGVEWELKTYKTPARLYPYANRNKLRGNFSASYFRAIIREANIDLKPGQKNVIGTTMVNQDVAMIVVVSNVPPQEEPAIIRGK